MSTTMHMWIGVTISHNMDTGHTTGDTRVGARAIDGFGTKPLITSGGMIILGIMGASMTTANG